MTYDSQMKRTLSLLGAIAVMAVIWLVILPAHARQEGMRKHIDWLDQQGIDPSAMYYTELEVMEDILRRQRSTQLLSEAHHD